MIHFIVGKLTLQKNHTLFGGKLVQLKTCLSNNIVVLNVWLYLVLNSTKRSIRYFQGVVLLDYLHKGPSRINLVSSLFWHQREIDRYCSIFKCPLLGNHFLKQPKYNYILFASASGPRIFPCCPRRARHSYCNNDW